MRSRGLAADLSPDGAVQVALLNSHRLQGELAGLGIAQADLVQAGLLRNAVFDAQVRFPSASPSGTNLEFAVVQDFLSVLQIPMRKKVAAAQLETAKLRVAAAALALAADVQAAYFAVQAADARARLWKTSLETAEASLTTAEEMQRVGNLDTLAVVRTGLERERISLASDEAQADAAAARERFAALLGVEDAGSLVLPELATPVFTPVSEESVSELASTNRLDLAISRQEVAALNHSLGLARHARLLPGLSVGLDTEREPNGTWLTGPNVEVPIPIFDTGVVGVARARAQLRQAEERLRATEIEAHSAVRLALARYARSARRADAVENQVACASASPT